MGKDARFNLVYLWLYLAVLLLLACVYFNLLVLSVCELREKEFLFSEVFISDNYSFIFFDFTA